MCNPSRKPHVCCCALIRAAIVAGVLFSGLTWASDALAGCGDYIHFRGSPQMAVNPVARMQRGMHLPFGQDHRPDQAPTGCQGPHCSEQHFPTLPIPVRIILTQLQDCVLASFSPGMESPTAARLIEDESALPRQYALGIFRPPR